MRTHAITAEQRIADSGVTATPDAEFVSPP
jgi:hypothetical protein